MLRWRSTITYNFDAIIDRRQTDSIKWDVAENELPMWVADMDFQTAPEIIQSIENRVHHGIFGYTRLTDEWYDAYISWWKRRHGLVMEKESLLFVNGIVPAISAILRALTSPEDEVILQTPVYNAFFYCVRMNGLRGHLSHITAR